MMHSPLSAFRRTKNQRYLSQIYVFFDFFGQKSKEEKASKQQVKTHKTFKKNSQIL